MMEQVDEDVQLVEVSTPQINTPFRSDDEVHQEPSSAGGVR